MLLLSKSTSSLLFLEKMKAMRIVGKSWSNIHFRTQSCPIVLLMHSLVWNQMHGYLRQFFVHSCVERGEDNLSCIVQGRQ